MRLMASGSLVLTRPSVRDFTTTREELDQRAGDLFAWLTAGTLAVTISGRYPLEQAGQAQDDLSSRRSTGKLLLVAGADG
jgi:NADPH2:quinone reductase